MLKRNGQPIELSGPEPLTRGEVDAYNEAFEAIQDELASLKRVKDLVKGIAEDPAPSTIPKGSPADGIIEIPNDPADRWKIRSTLLKLSSSQVFLCSRTIQGRNEFSVIERFKSNSPYAQANGDTSLLLAGTDPVRLVEQYVDRARQTLNLLKTE